VGWVSKVTVTDDPQGTLVPAAGLLVMTVPVATGSEVCSTTRYNSPVPLTGRGTVVQMGLQQFDRHPVPRRVPAQIDDALTALTEPADQFVRADSYRVGSSQRGDIGHASLTMGCSAGDATSLPPPGPRGNE
jgi:hypothetical protein